MTLRRWWLRPGLPGQPWYCMEQPARDSTADAGLGVALALETAGGDRFKVLERRWRVLSERALADSPDAPPGVGLVAMAGFAFAEDGAPVPPGAASAPRP